MAQNLKIKRFAYEFTRQADTTAYAAQDAVDSTSSGTTISPFIPVHADDYPGQPLVVGATYQIKNAKLTKSTNVTTNATFDLYFYTSGITIQAQDNQPFVLAYTNKHVRIGKTNFTMLTSSSSSDCSEAVNADVNLMFKAATTQFFPRLVATSAYAPGASEKFFIEVELLRIDE